MHRSETIIGVIWAVGMAFFLNLMIVRIIPARRISVLPPVHDAAAEMRRS
jgi:hypothetical protein